MRHLLGPALAAVVLSSASCGDARPIADLGDRFDEARKQPAAAAFEVADVTIDGITRRSIVAHGATRFTATVTVPKHAVLRTSLAVHPRSWEHGGAVLLSVGVSDGRSFQTRASLSLDPHSRPRDRQWHDVSVSLEEFAGLTVAVILNTRPDAASSPGAPPPIGVWGAPVIVAR